MNEIESLLEYLYVRLISIYYSEGLNFSFLWRFYEELYYCAWE